MRDEIKGLHRSYPERSSNINYLEKDRVCKFAGDGLGIAFLHPLSCLLPIWIGKRGMNFIKPLPWPDG